MTRKSTRGKRSKDKERKRLQRIQLLETFYHFPTDAAWRQTRATQLGLPFPNERGVSAQENTYGIELSKPSTCHHVLGDGNCFFSSLSYVITGQEHYQHVLRHRICQHLLNHQEELKTYLPSHYNGDVQQYLVQSRMESNATWATEVEIFTAAHMLRTNIFVYTQHGDRWTWLKHSVGQPEGNTSIYLYHQGRCHYDVVLGITTSDTEQREQKNRKERERYFTDPLYRDKKKTQAQRTYDSEFRDTKKMTLQQRYSRDESYRENKKNKTQQKYSSDESYRENKKIKTQQKYSSDESYRENKKITIKQRYSSDESYRENQKITSQQKYSSDESFRDNKKITSQQRYSSDESYRENKKITTQQKYASDEKYRNSKITRNKTDTKYRKHNVISTRQRYRTDIKYRNKKKQSARDRYHSQQLYRDHKKHMSILKYASNSQFRLTVRRYAVTKYKDIATFRNKVKTYSKKKYRQCSSFRNNLRAASIKKYASDPLFRSTLKKFLKQQYHQRRDIPKKKKAAVKERRASLDKAILAFRNSISDTPRYPCCVCARLLFKKQVKFCDRAKYMDNGVLHPIVEKCLIENFQYNSKQWICFTCDNHLRARKMPPQAMANGLHITPIPKELKTLNSLERQLVALRIPFMKLLSLPKGGQRGVKGQVVNVPSDINSVTTSLPRSIDNAQMIKVKLKRKMSYKGHHQYEWVNPSNVIEAIKYLIQNNPWYSNITFKENWFDEEDADIVYTENSETDTDIETDIKQNIQENLEKSSKQEQTSVNIQNVPSENPKLDADTERDKQEESFEENPSHTEETRHSSVSTGSVTDQNTTSSTLTDQALYDADTEEEKSSNDQAVYDADTDEEKSSNDQAVYDADTDDENQECKEKRQFGNKRTDRVSDEDAQSYPVETCLQPLDLGQEFLDTNDKIFCVAPGENQVPVSIFQEDGSDAMAFPVLLPDGKFGFSFEREIKITPSKYFNCRLFSADDRFAKDNQFIFYAQYMVEIHNIRSNISVALRKGQQTCGDGRKITASMLTRSENLQEILKSDTGYRFLQPVRGTPPYWQRTMKDLYAMIRQLGIPTWFVTFSAGETRWDEVIQVLMKDDKRNIADIEWAEKCCLIRENPVMCARLFNNRVKSLFTDLILSPAKPIGDVADYFYRTEFQQRGSPHIHCLFWVHDAPKLDKDSDDVICNFIDKYITCQLPDEQIDAELYDIVSSVQVHSKSHTKSCRKNSSTCRFHFPRPPVLKTFIARTVEDEPVPQKDDNLKPPTKEEFEENCRKASGPSAKEIVQHVWRIINSYENPEDLSINAILQAANITFEQFEESLTTMTNKNTVFYKRGLRDCWVNNYNPNLLRAWNANLDIQYVMDAYSCVAYILSYISKAEAEMGELLSNAKKEAREGNKEVAASMKHIGQVYMHNREVSAQEAIYRICSFHLKQCSRSVVFVPTGSNATKMSLPLSVLKSSKCPENSDQIWMSSVIDKYLARPSNEEFDNMCLAEFCSNYTVFPKSRPPKKSNRTGSLPVYELQNSLGYIKKKSQGKESIIRYPRFNRLKNPHDYYMTLVQLYVPHRESVTVPSGFKDYEEYVQLGMRGSETILEFINRKRKRFEIDNDDLEKAWEDFQEGKIGEDAWAKVAPESEAQRLDIEQETVSHNDDPEEESPELQTLGKKSDERKDTNKTIEYQKPKICQKEIQNHLRNMNKKQRQVFYTIRDWALQVAWKRHPPPFHLFLTGGAGTGKSHLIKCIYHETSRILSKSLDNPDCFSVLLTAPTGTAAFNIGGSTLHSTFSISKNIKLPYTPLGENLLNTMRSKFDSISLVIIDEVSMVDQKLLTYIHGRLCQLKQSKKIFGNVSILAVGDFYQLPPVKASPLYKIKDSTFLDLWNPVFSIVTLDEVMRQREDGSFAAMLNRLRVRLRDEPLLATDSETLTSVACDKTPPHSERALHIFPTNKEVAKHNEEMVNVMCNPCVSSIAKDYSRDTVSGKLHKREQPYSNTSPDDLLEIIKLGVGARIMLTRNVDTVDGLVNGAFGTITALEQTHGDIKAVYVKFDNSLCGSILMSKTIATLPGTKDSVRITHVEETLRYKNAIRKQLPLKLGWAATIHKVQGMTTSEIVVSLKKCFQPGMAYVALSRATSLSGLHILHLDMDSIYASEEIKSSVDSMPEFLPKSNQDQQQNSAPQMKIVMHNTQGLLAHANDIRNADVFEDADIVCFTETWLDKSKYIPPSILQHFKVHTMHRESAYTTNQQLASKERGGVAMFVHEELPHSKIHLQVQNVECIGVQMNSAVNISIFTVYRPPVYPLGLFSNALKHLLAEIDQVNQNPILIVGDFNDDHLKENSKLLQIFLQHGYQQLVQFPTTEAGSCLDLVYVKGFKEVPEVTIAPLYYSFHEAIVIST